METVKCSKNVILWGTLLLCMCAFSATAMDEESVCDVCTCREFDVQCTGISASDLLRSYDEAPVRKLIIADSFLEELSETFLEKFSTVSELNIQNSALRDNDNLFRLVKEVTKIDLQNNSLTRISADTFSTNEKLLSLDLRNNKIKSIERNAFLHLTSLSILTLSGNEIERLENDTFAGLSELTVLDLSGNHLKELDGVAFTDTDNMRYLLLSGNQLQNLVVSSELKLLSTLDLSGNNFDTLEEYGFQDWKMLQNLNLSNNLITYVNDKSLTGLNLLKTLDLSKNLISVIDDFAFENQEFLEVLNLSDNVLESITDITLMTLSNLSLLNLSGNLLTYVSGDLLAPLEELREIHLEENALIGLNSDVVWLLANRKIKASFRGNPFDCMCHTLGAAYSTYSTFAITPTSSLDIFCDGDDSMPWSDVIPALNCPTVDDYDFAGSPEAHLVFDWDLENTNSEGREANLIYEDNEYSDDYLVYEDSKEHIIDISSREEKTDPGDNGDSILKINVSVNEESVQFEEDLIQTIKENEVTIVKMQKSQYNVYSILLCVFSGALLSMLVALVMSFLYRRLRTKVIKTSDSDLLLT